MSDPLKPLDYEPPRPRPRRQPPVFGFGLLRRVGLAVGAGLLMNCIFNGLRLGNPDLPTVAGWAAAILAFSCPAVPDDK